MGEEIKNNITDLVVEGWRLWHIAAAAVAAATVSATASDAASCELAGG